MSPITIDEILRKVHNLPSLPLVVMELLATMEAEDVNIGELADKIAKDQTLTAKTLRLANSSFYGRAYQISTIHDAISVLGFRTVRNLVTTAALIGGFNQSNEIGFNATPFWKHSLACAICAKELAPHMKVNPEQAYASGLLHDIGRLVLVTQFQTSYGAAMAHRITNDCSLLHSEKSVLGLTHAVVGEIIARQWKLPQAIQLAIAGHHDPSISEMSQMTFVILAADAISHALNLSHDPSEMVPALPVGFMERLGLDEQTLFQVFKNTESQFGPASLVLTA